MRYVWGNVKTTISEKYQKIVKVNLDRKKADSSVRQTYKLRAASRPDGRATDRQADRQMDEQAGRQADRQTEG